MKKSLFIEFISGIWPKLALYVKEKIDPKERTYLHKTMLREVYSADQKWEGTSAKTTYVAADMVAMDSPLPIKKRGSLASSNGKLPKVGMKKILRETEINTINIMKAHYTSATTDEARKAEKNRIIQNLTDDGVACSVGIDEKNEANFLTGFCEGIVLVEDEDNSGTGLRVNYGYLDENTFGTIIKGELSKEDFENVNDKANEDGNTIVGVMMSKTRFDAMRRQNWAKSCSQITRVRFTMMVTNCEFLQAEASKRLSRMSLAILSTSSTVLSSSRRTASNTASSLGMTTALCSTATKWLARLFGELLQNPPTLFQM